MSRKKLLLQLMVRKTLKFFYVQSGSIVIQRLPNISLQVTFDPPYISLP